MAVKGAPSFESISTETLPGAPSFESIGVEMPQRRVGRPSEEFHGHQVDADNLVARFGKKLANSFAEIGETIISSPLSPIGIPERETQAYRQQAIAELEQSGFRGNRAQAEQLIKSRAAKLAAIERVPKFDVEPAEGIPEKATDVVAGLAAFISQLALTKKILPKGTPDPVIWEVQNQLGGGVPGQGMVTRQALGGIGRVPTGTAVGKAVKVGAESALFAGVTGVLGGETEDIIISALVPVAFNAWSFTRQKQHLRSYERQLKQNALKSYEDRIKSGMLEPVSMAHLKADRRIVEDLVAKAKQRIYRDDAFAPAKEKWDAERQKALKMVASGKRDQVRRGNAILDFVGKAEPARRQELEIPTTRVGEAAEAIREIGQAVRHPFKTAQAAAARGKPPVMPKAPTVTPAEPLKPERPIEGARARVTGELERRKAEVAAGPAEGPLIAQRYTRMEQLIEQFQAEQDPARRDDMIAEMEHVEADIELLSDLQGKDIKELHRVARRVGVTVPKGSGKTAIMRLLGGTADLSRIQKTDTGYRIEVPLAETEAGRGWTVREFDNFAEAVDFLSEQRPPEEGGQPARITKPPTKPVEPPTAARAPIVPEKKEPVSPPAAQEPEQAREKAGEPTPEQAPEEAYFVKVRPVAGGQSLFLDPEGKGTTRRVYASIIRNREQAERIAREITAEGEYKAWVQTPKGKRVKPAAPELAEAAPEAVEKPAKPQVEKPEKVSGEQVGQIEEILTAARKPVPNIVEIGELKGTNDKWYRPFGFPSGVQSTGERRVAGYAYQSPEGQTYGTRGKTHQELIDRHEAAQDKAMADFRAELEKKTPEELAESATFWREEAAKRERLKKPIEKTSIVSKYEPMSKEALAKIKQIDKELRTLRQSMPVAEDMAVNDRGASLRKLEKKIADLEAERAFLFTPGAKPEKPLAKPPEKVVELKEEKEVEHVEEPTTEVRVGVRKAGREGVEAEPPEAVEEAEQKRPTVRGAPGGRKAGRPVHGESTTTGDRLSDSGGSSTPDVDTSTRPGPRSRRTASPAGPTGVDYRITEADEIGKGGPKTKYRNNITAIKLLKQIESQDRKATPEEQAVLVKYVGWGGMPQVFDRYKKDWSDEYKELEELLTDEEYQAARASTPNAHYTSFEVIGGIWKGLQDLGFKGGRINEPSLGIGHFYGLIPDKIAAKSRLHGVELDEISGRIAKQLYQTADIQVKGFEKVKYPDNFFDLFISNVPFGDYRVHDPDMRKVTFKIHDFFFAKAIRKTRPGGLIAFITSRYTLDKKNSTVRDYLAKEADFVGAVRLPKTAFKEIAATEVVTDILIFQKRDPKKYYAGQKFKSLKDVEVGGEQFAINEYYQGRLGNILGTLSYTGTMYAGKEITVEPNPKIIVGERVAEIIGNIELPEAIDAKQKALQEERSKPDYIVPAPDHVKERAYTLHNKRLVQNIDGKLALVKAPQATKQRIKKLVEVRDSLRDLLHKQLDPETSEAIVEKSRKKLETVYTKFTRQYKPITDAYNQRVFSEDPDLPMLLALEEYDREKKQLTAKAKIFTQRTQFPYKEITHVENSEDGLKVSLNEKGAVDVEYIAELSGQSEQEVVDTLAGHIFFDPAMSSYQPAAMYLSGNVRRKLREAEAALETTNDPQYKGNVDTLKKVQPEDLKPADIDVRLGAGWIDPEVYRQFYFHLDPGSPLGSFRMVESQGAWIVTGSSSYGEKTWGSSKVSALRLIELAMNQKRPDVKKAVIVDGKTKVVIDKDETIAAETKQQRIKDEFKKWVWEDADRAKSLVRKYNDLYNDTVFPEWDGSHLKLPGKVSDDVIKLRDHQNNVIWRFLTNGNLLMGHDVGAGKTYAGAAMAMEARRLGIVKKPLFVVPNHLISQWRNSWIKLYPSATLLVTTEKDFTPKNRQTVMNRIATGDWDGIIVPFSSFEKIPMTPEITRSFIQGEIDALRVEYESAKSEKAERSYVKELEKAAKRLHALLEKQQAQWKKDKGPFFDELGIDMMFIDEAHQYKNLFFRTQMTRVAGVQQSFVQMSFDVLMKTRHINKVSNGRGLVFATGTPITNTMAEIYTMQRYLQPDLLKEKGFESFDLWAHNFGEQVTEVEISPEGGGFRMHTRFKRFTNVPALMQMFRMVTDIKNKHDLGLKLPKVKGGEHVVFSAEGSQTLKSYVRRLVSRMEDIRKGAVDPKVDNALKVTTDGRKAALDMRLIDKSLPDYPGSKVNKCVENVHEIWQKTTKTRDTQVIWCDLGVPNTEGRWEVYADIKKKLIKKGVPAGEIAFIHDIKDKSRLDAFYRKVNEGAVRIVIASSQRMSTGANVQERLLAAHHLDAPWRPADIEQRDGRIIRWGNRHEEVQIYRYVTKGSFDAYIWQTLENKAKFIGQIMTGKATPNEIVGDFGTSALSYAEVKALAAENPKIMEAVQLDAEVGKLQALRQSHINEQYEIRQDLASLPRYIERGQNSANAERADYADYQKAKEAAGDKLDFEIAGKKYTKHKEAGEALIAVLEANAPQGEGKTRDTKNVGKVYGFAFDARGYNWKEWTSWDVTIKGRSQHGGRITNFEGNLDAVGSIKRTVNRLEELPGRADETEALIKRDKERLAAAQKVAGRKFEQQKELDAKAKKLRDLYTELDIEARTKGIKPDPTEEDEAKGEAGFAGVPGRPGGRVKKPWLTAEKIDSPDPAIKDFFRRTKRFGPKTASGLLDKVKAGLRERFIRTPHIPHTAETAYIRDIVRTMPEAKRAATEEAYEEYARVLDGDGSTEALSVTGLQLYAYKIFVEDFIVEAEAGRDVPGGFSLEQLKKEKSRVDKLVAKVPSVERAYKARQELWRKVSADLAERGVISHENARNPHYVRHFVLHYMESRPYSAVGAKRKKLKEPFRAYKIRRKGTVADVSTDILEVDTHALAEIYADNAVEDAANEIAGRYGERAKFTQLAKDTNFTMLVGGAENVRRIEQLRGMIAEIRESGDKPEPELLEELHELDPTWPFRQRIAIGMSKLHSALGLDEVTAYEYQMWGGQGQVSFAQMNSIIRNEPGTPQAAAAAGIFKAINDRLQFMKAVLGDKFITPERMAEGMGFVEWHYKRPNVFYRATTADAAKIAQMVEDAVNEVDILVPKAMLRDALVMGAKRKGWIIPQWLAAQLDDLPVNKRSGYIIDSLSKPFTMVWKRFILAVNWIRYNVRNLIGDSERLHASGRTHAFLRSAAGVKHLWNKGQGKDKDNALKYKTFKGTVGDIFNKSREHGVVGTSLWHEMGTAHRQKIFDRFEKVKNLTGLRLATAPLKYLIRTVSSVGGAIQDMTQFREDILRMGVFLDALDDVDNFRAGKPTRYGKHIRHWAGTQADIEALAREDPWRAAAKISRETLLDYGDFTPWENDVLRQGLAPFYSFMKKNAQFWPHAMIEATKEGGKGKGIAVAGTMVGWNLGKWAVRILFLYALSYLWNRRDDEAAAKDDALAPWLRSRPHLNVGDGTLWGQTALSDLTEWFNLDDIAGDLQRFDAGYITFNDLMKAVAVDTAKGPVNKLYQGLNPFLKAPVTALGYKTFPDVLKPRQFAKAWSSRAVREAVAEPLGTDVKRFMQAHDGKITVKEALSYYLVGSMYRDTSPEELERQIKQGLKYTSLKGRSPTTRRRRGAAKKGKESEHEILRARQKAVKKIQKEE